MLQIARRLTQALSLLFVILVPFLAYLNTLRQAYGIKGFHIANMSGGPVVGKFYAVYERTFGLLDEPVPLIDSVKGSFWSFTIFGFNISDPLAAIDFVLASKSIHGPLMASILIPVALTMILGRAFCGWVCPINTLTELLDRARSGLARILPGIPNINLGSKTKHWVLVGTVIIVVVAGIPLFSTYLPYVILGRELHNMFLFQAVGAGAYLLLILALFEFFISRRGWCRYLCPSGAMLSLIGSRSVVHITKPGSAKCLESCRECDRLCPMGLDVRNGSPGIDCTNCGDCLTVCPQGLLSYTYGFNRKSPVYTAAVVVALALILSTPASAHHMGGIPHYGYTENYPQVPLTEQSADVGDWIVSVTTIFFQGISQDLSSIPYDTQLYIHIRDRNATYSTSTASFKDPFNKGEISKTDNTDSGTSSYTGKILLTISDYQNNKLVSYSLKAPSEESIYRFRHYFKREGDYRVMVGFFPKGQLEEILFAVTIKTPGNSIWPIALGSSVVICSTLFLLYRKQKTTKYRKRKTKMLEVNP